MIGKSGSRNGQKVRRHKGAKSLVSYHLTVPNYHLRRVDSNKNYKMIIDN
jgi:hypothetical protein